MSREDLEKVCAENRRRNTLRRQALSAQQTEWNYQAHEIHIEAQKRNAKVAAERNAE